MKNKAKLAFGSVNYLEESSDLFGKKASFDCFDPQVLRKELAWECFDLLVTGVRWWPYLLMARMYPDESKNKGNIKAELKKWKETAGRYGHSEYSQSRIGNEQSMWQRIYNNNLDSGVKKLKDFLTHTKKPKKDWITLCRKKQKSWKAVFRKSMPDGQEFAKAIKKTNGFEAAITEVLRHPQKYKKIWIPASRYILLRCLYGIKSGQEFKRHGEFHKDWVKILKELKNRDKKISRYVGRLQSTDTPYSSRAKKTSQNGKKVLKDFKFWAFYQLYTNSVPQPGGKNE